MAWITRSARSPEDYAIRKLHCLVWKYKLQSICWNTSNRVLQTVTVLAGIVVAGLTAMGQDRGFFGLGHDIAIIVISGSGSAAAALLARLRFSEVARAREVGRVGFEKALLCAQTTLLKKDLDEKNREEILEKLRKRISEIEYDQINLIFPPTKPSTPPANTPAAEA
jgi:hypothetical protein